MNTICSVQKKVVSLHCKTERFIVLSENLMKLLHIWLLKKHQSSQFFQIFGMGFEEQTWDFGRINILYNLSIY
ncbi:hypothetical protein VIGAN_08053300 [Vigna angularis var. angularis]|uniref:Uncharacterized protein n=1 Tax=Vigna angularis var. angularis TaxID=157739 RepID=A0A0S3SM86_PHAAN|nr:hypothetical protein VIGAN_08053300 [Vigna angularis var. angularis]